MQGDGATLLLQKKARIMAYKGIENLFHRSHRALFRRGDGDCFSSVPALITVDTCHGQLERRQKTVDSVNFPPGHDSDRA